MQLQTQRRTVKTQGYGYWKVDRKWNTDLVIIIFGSIIGFAVLFAGMIYITSMGQH